MSAKISSFPGTSGRSADLLLEKLQDPKVAESLVSLLEKSQVLNDFLERSEVMLNSITKGVGDLGRVGVATLSKTFQSVELNDIKAAGGQLQAMIPAVRDFMAELGSLKESGFFDPEVVKVFGRTARAMSAAARDPDAHSDDTYGIFSVGSLLKDPEIARTLNFFISFARHFGGDLKQDGAGSANEKK
jgi:hypothetical protein